MGLHLQIRLPDPESRVAVADCQGRLWRCELESVQREVCVGVDTSRLRRQRKRLSIRSQLLYRRAHPRRARVAFVRYIFVEERRTLSPFHPGPGVQENIVCISTGVYAEAAVSNHFHCTVADR